MKKIYTRNLTDMSDLFTNSGLEIVNSPSEADYGYTDGENILSTFISDCAESGLTVKLNPHLSDKVWLMQKITALGFKSIPTVELKTRVDLENFPYEKIISKPTSGFGSSSVSPFDYVTYNSKEEALAAFDNDTTDTLGIRKPILQPSYSVDGLSKILMLSAIVNGSGVLHIEPCVIATHKEGVGPVYFSTRGCNEDEPGLDLAKHTIVLLTHTEKIRNAFVHVQFIWTGTEYLAMDASHRMDYHNRYILTKFGDTHPQDVVRFAFDITPTVESECGVVSVMKYINISPSVGSDTITQAMEQKNVKLLVPHKIDRWRLFGAIGTTEEDVVNRINEFESMIT